MNGQKKTMEKGEAPDGGYGWIIVLAFAGSNFLIIPILQIFGLLYRSTFQELNFSATDISTIINFNSAFGMLMGLWNGPLLRRFGYRKMAAAGSLMNFIGLVLTSRANSLLTFVLFYGILPSYGIVALMASFNLSLNTYFKKRRSFAAGITMTLTGLGPIIMPLVISKLLDYYTVRDTALIIAALSLHSMIGVLLLQPVKWHYKKAKGDAEEAKALNEDNCSDGMDAEDVLMSMPASLVQSVTDLEGAMQPRRVSVSLSVREYDGSQHDIQKVTPDDKWWSKNVSTSSLHRHSVDHSNSVLRSRTSLAKSEEHIVKDKTIEEEKEPVEEEDQPAEENPNCFKRVVTFFELDLLKDPIYFNIWMGMSLAFTAEINFSLMTPIILGDRQFDVSQTAKIMSVVATTDIIFRFLAPFVGQKLKWPARQMYAASLVMLIITRTTLTFVSSYTDTMIVFGFLGVAKGFRTVYMTLVIPNHVSLDKLPSASSLQTVLNGFFLSIFGPLLGYLRDLFGNYNACIYMINVFTLATLVLWSIEFIICLKKKRKLKTQENSKPTELNNSS